MTGYYPELDDAPRDAEGHPECGDEYCPGFPDCSTCSDMRQQEWLRYETSDGNDRTA